MRPFNPGARAVTAFAVALYAVPAGLAGQEAPRPRQPCTAEISPAALPAGSDAVRVMASLSEDVGVVRGVEGSEESGIAMASPDEMPRTELVTAGGEAGPIQMGADENTWALWLNTAAARPGSHSIRIVADGGVCEGRVSISPRA